MGLLEIFKNWMDGTAHSSAGTEKLPQLEEILKKIEVYKRTAWMPVIEEEKQEVTASKIGGQAYIPKGETYPLCPNCKQELTLFLQLRPQDLPGKNDLDLEPDKLIQLFYCTNDKPHCEIECEAWFPFSKSVLARTLPLPEGKEGPVLPTAPKRQFTEKGIVDWVEAEDYPDWQEMQKGDAQLNEKEVEVLEISETGTPKAADKLGGWPYWVQGVEYPICPECGIQMQMIFQLDSNNHLPYMFGDAGIGHLHQCRLHKKVLAFGWAAY